MPSIKTLEGDGVDRRHLPQIPKSKLAEFVRFLRQNEATVVVGSVAAEIIKPIQTEINQDKVNAMKSNIEEFRNDPLIVSKNMWLMDGHHRWFTLNQQDPRTKVKIIHVQLPMKELVSLAKEFEGSFSKDIDEMKLSSLVPKTVKQKYSTGYLEWL